MKGANFSGSILFEANLFLSKDKMSNIQIGDGQTIDVVSSSPMDLVNKYIDLKSSHQTAASTLSSVMGCLNLDLSGKDLNGKDASELLNQRDKQYITKSTPHIQPTRINVYDSDAKKIITYLAKSMQ